MRSVLHLGKFYPPDAGGIESVTAALARAAVVAGWHTEVLCFAEHATGSNVDQGVTVVRVPQIAKPASQPLGLRYLWTALRKGRQADVVHIHVPNMLAALLTPWLGPRPKVLVHWHSDVIGKGLIGRLLAPVERRMLQRADAVVCTSQPYADASITLRPFKDKITVIPLGVPTTEEAPSALLGREALQGALRQHVGERPLVLCVGRLVPYKGYATLIEAACQLQSDAAIVVVGGGPLEAELKAQVTRQGVGGRVMFTGRVDDATLAALQHLATVYCMPSVERSEAFGVALIEAMSKGLPLLATEIPGSGVPWVNKHRESGLNVRPGDAGGLAEALDQLLGDAHLRQQLSKGGRSRYLAFFTEQRMVEKTLSLYESLLDGGSRSSGMSR